jgi:hypothetical protein
VKVQDNMRRWVWNNEVMRFLALLLCGSSWCVACSCLSTSVDNEVRNADIVFRGKIVRIGYGRISFAVSRAWKGPITSAFSMPDIRESTDCIGFWPSLVEIGNELLVYARDIRPPRGTRPNYVTNICSRTQLISTATEDLKFLGPGLPPRR